MSSRRLITRVSFDENGFTIKRGRKNSPHIAWDQIREIAAYRKDPAGRDLLRLAFRVTNYDQYVDVDEESPEYAELLEKMYETFPSINPNWWQKITADFGRNWTTIHGLPLCRQGKHSPAERYLQKKSRRKGSTSRFRRQGRMVVGLFLLAWVLFLPTWGIGSFSESLAVVLAALTAAGLIARLAKRPKKFYAMLLLYHLLAWLVHLLTAGVAPCLLSELLAGRLGFLLLVGGEILLGMGVMNWISQRPTVMELPKSLS